MAVHTEQYQQIVQELQQANATLVAVSKTKPVEDIRELYALGQRDFGENYVQELTEKQPQLPADIRWHFIGHLQSNKIKFIVPFVHLIHGVDRLSLLEEINKQALKQQRVIDCLLQVYIAREETKFGLDETELDQIMSQMQQGLFPGVQICGLMGMASFTDHEPQIRSEFQQLRSLYQKYRALHPSFQYLSMGMSGDYQIALAEGSTMVRIGSLLFGARS